MAFQKVLTGNHAVSWGAKLARVQVISAYPITPQTTIVELLSEMVASGELKAKFITVESEHSAMAACVAASAAGARAFTATSAQGLALMHEMLHWAVGARLPIVLANVTRAMAPPWSIWSEHTDFISQRDVGWMQLFAESNQEALDFILWLYKVGEQVYLPGMVALDAFILSHTFEPVTIHDQERVDEYLPPFKPIYDLNPAEPRAWGGLANRDQYAEFRYKIQKAHERALQLLREEGKAFAEIVGGKAHDVVDTYMLDDADYVLVSAGALSSNVRYAVHQLRQQGEKVGFLRLIALRPFPAPVIRELLAGRKKVGVIDRDLSPGMGGVIAQEIRNALYGLSDAPPIYGYIVGLGGRDVQVEKVLGIYQDLKEREEPLSVIWTDITGVPMGPGHKPDEFEIRPLPELPKEATQ